MLDYLGLHGFFIWDGRLTEGEINRRYCSLPPRQTAQGMQRPWKGIVWRNYVGPVLHGHGRLTPSSAAGVADIAMVCRCGSFFGFEVKTETGVQSAKQLSYQACFTAIVQGDSGIHVVRTIEELAEIIEAHVCSK